MGETYWIAYHTGACDSTYSNVYITRVNANGTVLDASGLLVCTAEGDQRQTSLTPGDSRLLVLWEDDRSYDSTGYDVYGTRLALDGTVLDPDGMAMAKSDLFEEAPAACWADGEFLAIWQSSYYGTYGDINAVRMDTSGMVSDSVPAVLSTACDAQILAGSGWSGFSYLAIWDGGGDLRGARVDKRGDVLDSSSIDICSACRIQSAPDVIWGSENYLVVWEDDRNGEFDIYGARIDSGGTVLDSPNLALRVDPLADQRYPAVGFDGSNYLVVWQNMLDSTGAYYRIEGQRISTGGDPVDPQPFPISSGDKGGLPDVAFGGGKYLVVWQDNFFYDIYGSLVDTMGTLKSQFGIRTSSGVQESPAVASEGSQFLVVWVDYGNHWPNADILASRVTTSGTVLDPGGILVASTSDAELSPSVGFDGTNFVVSWNRSVSGTSEFYVGRVTPQGIVLDPDGIFISNVSTYSLTSVISGPLGFSPSDTAGQSLLLYSKYQFEPHNSPRMFGALFWGEPTPNYPPETFSLLLPSDQDTVRKPVLLDWEDALDPNPSDQITYTAFVSSSETFPTESTLVFDSLLSSDFLISPEGNGVVYWWKVRAQDRWGETVWSNQILRFCLESYGDVNGDGGVDLGDAVFLLNYLFKAGSAPSPLAVGDVNGDCNVDIGDAIYLLNYLFKAGPSPVAGCA